MFDSYRDMFLTRTIVTSLRPTARDIHACTVGAAVFKGFPLCYAVCVYMTNAEFGTTVVMLYFRFQR